MPPLLTIGLPVYNAEKWLGPALQSIFAQELQDWELIAVDDASSDGSAQILGRWKDPRVQVVRSSAHRGLAAQLNHIHQSARGRYIARMDADDLMHPARLARQVEFLERSPDVDVVGSAIAVLDRASQPVGKRVFPARHAQIAATLGRGLQFCHASAVGRASWWQRFRYNEQNSGCEDLELWITALPTSHFANLPDLLYYYREYSSFSLSKYLRARSHFAAMIWRRHEAGRLRAAVAAAGQLARAGVYLGAGAAGLADWLLARRSLPLSDAEQEQCQASIRRVLATPLPGAAPSP